MSNATFMQKMIARIKIASLFTMALAKGEGFALTDYVIDDPNFRIEGTSSMQSKFDLVYDEDANEIELRDGKGYRVISFEANEKMLERYPDIIDKDSYKSSHNLFATRKATIGDKLYKEVYNEKDGTPVSFTEIKESNVDDAFAYEIDSADKLIQVINALTGSELESLSRTPDKSVVRILDTETGVTAQGGIRDVLFDALRKYGYSEEEIQNITGIKEPSLDEIEEDVFFGDETTVESKVYDEKTIDGLLRDKDGNLIVEDASQLHEATAEEILGMLETKLQEYAPHSELISGTDIREFLSTSYIGARITEKDLSDLYSYIVLCEQGRGERTLHKMNKRVNDDVKSIAEQYQVKRFHNKNLANLSSSELIELMDKLEEQRIEEAEKEDRLATRGAKKYEKQAQMVFKEAKVTKKMKDSLEQYHYEEVEKHEDAVLDHLEEAEQIEGHKRFIQLDLLYKEFADAIEVARVAKVNAQYMNAEGILDVQQAIIGINHEFAGETMKIDASELTRMFHEEEQEEETEDADVKEYVIERTKQQVPIMTAKGIDDVTGLFYEVTTDNLEDLIDTNEVPAADEIEFYDEDEEISLDDLEDIDSFDLD